MAKLIGVIIVGAILIVIGAINMSGNISTLHSYHRNNVKEENRKPFGKMVGLGGIICGATIIIKGVIDLIENYAKIESLKVVGNVVLIVGLILGLGLSTYAIIKYNKRLF